MMSFICPNFKDFIADMGLLALAFAFVAYLIGSIPFGLILTRIFTKQDITKIGSGNIGATNVLRTGNKKLAAFTLFLDSIKGTAIVIFAPHILQLYPFVNLTAQCNNGTENPTILIIITALLYGLFAILGHCFPVWLKFKGGKGVATTLGVLLAAVPFTGLIAIATWLLSAFTVRISSLAAISAMLVAPAFTYLFYGLYPAIINALISALVIYRHKDNIKRIRAGTEPRIGDKKKDT